MSLQVATISGVKCIVDSSAPTTPVTDLGQDIGDVVALNADVLRAIKAGTLGAIPDGSLSANIPKLDAANSFGGAVNFTAGPMGLGRSNPRVMLDIKSPAANNFASVMIVAPNGGEAILSLDGYYPGVGFNVYSNTSNADIFGGGIAGYAGRVKFDPTSGTISFQSTTGTYSSGQTVSLSTIFSVSRAGNARFAGNLGVGNSAAGSSLGTVVKKIQIYDASGTSLGFIPVYDAIT